MEWAVSNICEDFWMFANEAREMTKKEAIIHLIDCVDYCCEGGNDYDDRDVIDAWNSASKAKRKQGI